MLGAIAGDIIGSVYEHHSIKTTKFPLFVPACTFTDDTVLTIAAAYAILENEDFVTSFKKFGRRYPFAGYGGSFIQWLFSEDCEPYNSWGNGSAMRVSPVGFAFNTIQDVLQTAAKSAAVTHNHPQGIIGAQATALAIFLARTGSSKKQIQNEISDRFDYQLNRALEDIRPVYTFDVSCQGSVPEAIIAFLESEDFESAIRNGISLGGDSDTIACIAGGIAQAFYKTLPEKIVQPVREKLPDEFLAVVDDFNAKFGL
ncbi:MAG: ADP-ribosylglycohydrolase family protein [bacterium]